MRPLLLKADIQLAPAMLLREADDLSDLAVANASLIPSQGCDLATMLLPEGFSTSCQTAYR